MNCKLAVAGLLSLAIVCPLGAQAQQRNMFKPASPSAPVAATPIAKNEVVPAEPTAPKYPEYQIQGEYLGSVDGRAVFKHEGQYFFEDESAVAPRALRNSLRKNGSASSPGLEAGKPMAGRADPLNAVPPPIPDKYNPLPRQNKLP